jgi:hypothetical protein
LSVSDGDPQAITRPDTSMTVKVEIRNLKPDTPIARKATGASFLETSNAITTCEPMAEN